MLAAPQTPMPDRNAGVKRNGGRKSYRPFRLSMKLSSLDSLTINVFDSVTGQLDLSALLCS